MARPSCLRLLVHWIRRAASRAAWTAGSSRAISTAMMAMTTSSSIKVKAGRFRVVVMKVPGPVGTLLHADGIFVPHHATIVSMTQLYWRLDADTSMAEDDRI